MSFRTNEIPRVRMRPYFHYVSLSSRRDSIRSWDVDFSVVFTGVQLFPAFRGGCEGLFFSYF